MIAIFIEMQPFHVFTQIPHMLMADLKDYPPEESPLPPDTAIFSRERLLKIRRYASHITDLPLELYGALTALDDAYPQLRLHAFLNDATAHGHSWRHIERTIVGTGTALQQFGGKVVKNGTEIVRMIHAMPVMERIRTLKEAAPSFGKEDERTCRTIRSVLSQLRLAAVSCKTKAANLYKEMSAFRETMDNQISPASRRICDTINTIPPLEISARFGGRSYKITMAHSRFLENSPIGRGLLADIFNAQDENAFLKAADKIDRLLVPMSNRILDNFQRMQSLGTVIGDTVSGIQNLDTMLGGVIAYLENAEREVAVIKETDRLLTFQNHIRTAVESWEEICRLSTELSNIFTNPTQH